MPKIPMANMPGNVKVIDHSARAQGVPSDFGMAKARGILKAAEGLKNMGEGIGKGMMDYAETKWKLNKALEAKEDQLAMDEAEAAYKRKQFDLNRRIKENPNEVDNFGKWAEEVDSDWEAEEQQYVERMSDNARKRYQLIMNERRYTDVQNRNHMTTMAKTAKIYNQTKDLLAEQCRIGDWKGAVQILENAQNGDTPLFSDEEYRKIKEEYIPQQQQLNEIMAAEQNNDFSVIDKLSAQNEDGSYSNFNKIPLEKRMNLIRDLKGKKATLNTDFYSQVQSDFLHGKMSLTIDELNKKHDNQEINTATYIATYELIKRNEQRLANESMTEFKVQSYLGDKPPQTSDEIKKDLSDGKITKQEFLGKMDIALAYEAARAQSKREVAKLNEQNFSDALIGRYYITDIPLHPAENAIAKEKAYQEVMKNISNPKLRNSTLKAIDQIFADGLAGKGIFSTTEGKYILDWFNNTFRNKSGEFINLDYDTWFMAKDVDSQEFQQGHFYKLLNYAAQLLTDGDPVKDIEEKVNKKRKSLTEQDVKKILNKITERNSKQNSNLINAADKKINSQKDK